MSRRGSTTELEETRGSTSDGDDGARIAVVSSTGEATEGGQTGGTPGGYSRVPRSAGERGLAPGWPDRTARALDALRARSAWLGAPVVALLLAGCWAIAVASGQSFAVSRHLFYVPVLLGAAWFGVRGGVVTGVVALLLAGPLAGAAGGPDVWLLRGVFFVGIGFLMGGLFDATESAHRRELALADQERHLAVQRAALIQTVSHEFRTPLTIIYGVSQTLTRREDAVDPAIRPLVGSLSRATNRLYDMVSVVLAAGESSGSDIRLQRVEVALAPLIHDVVRTLEWYGADRVRVIAPGDPRVITVESYVRLLLRCLVENALKFSHSDEPVDVHVDHGRNETTVEVRDRGPGISEEFLERAFDPFTQQDPTATRQHGGLGLGLFTAKRLTEELDGRIDLRPAPDVGLIATVRLPTRPGPVGV